MAVSCGAVLAVYTAGYVRTQAAVDRFEAQAAERRREVQGPPPSEYFLPQFRPPAPTDAFERPHAPPAGKPTQILAEEPAPTPVSAPAPAPAETPAPPPAEPAHVAVPVPVPVAEPKPEVAAALPMWKDGSYLGWGTSRHGNIQAEVVVEGGRIASTTIAQCRTRYSCSVIDRLPPQVAQRQSPDVDYVSGATESANAFYFAVVDALSKAK